MPPALASPGSSSTKAAPFQRRAYSTVVFPVKLATRSSSHTSSRTPPPDASVGCVADPPVSDTPPSLAARSPAGTHAVDSASKRRTKISKWALESSCQAAKSDPAWYARLGARLLPALLLIPEAEAEPASSLQAAPLFSRR